MLRPSCAIPKSVPLAVRVSHLPHVDDASQIASLVVEVFLLSHEADSCTGASGAKRMSCDDLIL